MYVVDHEFLHQAYLLGIQKSYDIESHFQTKHLPLNHSLEL